MKNTKANILKVLKAKRDAYWDCVMHSTEESDHQHWVDKWYEIEKTIQLFEDEKVFNEVAKCWL